MRVQIIIESEVETDDPLFLIKELIIDLRSLKKEDLESPNITMTGQNQKITIKRGDFFIDGFARANKPGRK